MSEEYISFVMTNAGENIVTRMLAGLDITFKRIALGDGFDYDVENFVTRQNLVNEVISLDNLTMVEKASNIVELGSSFSKTDITKSFWYREIGIYIIDPDNPENEILYAYGNRNDNAEYITPHIDNYAISKEIKCLLKVGSSANVHIYISSSTITTTIDFAESDWIYDEINNVYNLSIGAVQDCMKVLKNTENGKCDTALVDIIKDSSNVTSLRALKSFNGSVICI